MLHGASVWGTRAYSSTSVIVAFAGIVAHRVTVPASASVQLGAPDCAVSAVTPGGVAAPGGLTTNDGLPGPPAAAPPTRPEPILRHTLASISARAPARVCSSWLAVRVI